jgi:hypothetical protein
MAYTRKTSDIFTSHELDYVLEQIKDNSEVARLLLKHRHPIESLVENHINYLSISNSDKTKISYLTTERAQNIIESSPYGSGADELWSSTRRFHAKPGAFIGKVFKNIHPKEVEIFSTLFRNIQSKIDFSFKVVTGSNIRKYYHYQSYYSESGSLGNSCMKYDSCQDYLELYTENKDVCSLLIAVDGRNRLIGRALLWDFSDQKIMDRIYTINDEDFQFHFKKWADDNGYIYKREQKWNNTLYFESKGKTIFKEISFQIDSTNLEHYPYMDTFKFLDFDNNTLYNYIPNGVDIKTLSSAEGNYQSGDIYGFCEKTKTLHSKDNLNFVPSTNMTVCSDITVYSSIFDCYILREDGYYNPIIRDWVYKDESLNNQDEIKKALDHVHKMDSFNFTPYLDMSPTPEPIDQESIEHPF